MFAHGAGDDSQKINKSLGIEGMKNLKKALKYFFLYSIIFPMGMFPGNVIRRIVLPFFTKKCGKRFWVYPDVHIFAIENLECGNFVNINCKAYINCSGGVKIGNYSGVGPLATIQSSYHNYPLGIPHKLAGDTYKQVVIGDDCLIGAGSQILPGAAVGDGCVVLPGSVVSGKFDANYIIGGNPARIIKKRG